MEQFLFYLDYIRTFVHQYFKTMAKEVISNTGTVYSVLAYGTKIVGNIMTDNDFRIDGEVEGDICCKGKLVMGPQSYLKGSINCINAEILGKVDAKIQASEMLILRNQAVINGEITMSTLMIEAGAHFNGACKMMAEEA
jgi:cytoskeletal protein CcmA (bactofilin family)